MQKKQDSPEGLTHEDLNDLDNALLTYFPSYEIKYHHFTNPFSGEEVNLEVEHFRLSSFSEEVGFVRDNFEAIDSVGESEFVQESIKAIDDSYDEYRKDYPVDTLMMLQPSYQKDNIVTFPEFYTYVYLQAVDACIEEAGITPVN